MVAIGIAAEDLPRMVELLHEWSLIQALKEFEGWPDTDVVGLAVQQRALAIAQCSWKRIGVTH